MNKGTQMGETKQSKKSGKKAQSGDFGLTEQLAEKTIKEERDAAESAKLARQEKVDAIKKAAKEASDYLVEHNSTDGSQMIEVIDPVIKVVNFADMQYGVAYTPSIAYETEPFAAWVLENVGIVPDMQSLVARVAFLNVSSLVMDQVMHDGGPFVVVTSDHLVAPVDRMSDSSIESHANNVNVRYLLDWLKSFRAEVEATGDSGQTVNAESAQDIGGSKFDPCSVPPRETDINDLSDND